MSQKTPQLDMSSLLLWQEAEKRGITCTDFGDRQTILMKSGEKTWYTRGSRTSLQSSVGKSIADNKSLTKKILHHHNLPTAKSVEVGSAQDLDAVSQLTVPLVMKPKAGRHGSGVVIGLKSRLEIETAFSQAKTTVLFEEMLKGTEYRIVCVDFHFVAAAFRKPAYVIGDGQKNIQELVAEKNLHPYRGSGHSSPLSNIIIDESVTTYLKEQGFDESTVLKQGQEAFLKKTANLSTGGEAWDVTSTVCEENKELFEKIARVCDLNTIGIDMMCESLSTPILQQTSAGVIEVNASPGLRMHHFPIDGQPINVAAMILDMVQQKY